jgi:uncharacterized protein HemX
MRRILMLQVAVVLIIVLAVGAGFYNAERERDAAIARSRNFQTQLFDDIEARLISKREVAELREEIRKLNRTNTLLAESTHDLRVRVQELNKELAKPPR